MNANRVKGKISQSIISFYGKFVNLINSGQKLFAINENIEELIRSNKEIVFALNAQNNPEYFEKICSLLQVKTPKDIKLIRFGREFDGGYITADFFPPNSVAYSFGINDDVSWDKDIAYRGIPVFMYDHTIKGLPEQHENFHFYPTGVGSKTTKCIATLSELISRNGHEGFDNLILKMDIEGSEYDVINTCDIAILEKFSQIIIEWHNILAPSNNQLTQALEKINSLFQCVHLHGQYVPCVRLGNTVLPNFMEATYLRKADHMFTEAIYTGPLDIDYPTSESVSEIYLGDYSAK